jgi:NADH-quinone oxidoreductase subunit J
MQVPVIELKKVSLSLYREYIIAVELVGFLLMAGIVGAAHIGKHKKDTCTVFYKNGMALRCRRNASREKRKK